MKARSRRSNRRPRRAGGALRRRLARLGRDEGGQITFIALFGLVAFVGLLGMVVTTGDQAGLKVEQQNATDAAALSGAAWVARGLNVTSAFNVLESQLVAGAILLNALEETIRYSRYAVEAMNAGYLACMATVFGAAICTPLYVATRIQLFVLYALDAVLPSLTKALSKCDNGLFWVLARALEKLNAAVRVSFYGIAFVETLAVAKANGAELAVLLPGPLFHAHLGVQNLMLPTEKREFAELCDPMERGSPTARERGYHVLLDYDTGEGPYKLGKFRLKVGLAFITGLPVPVGPFILEALARAQKATLCTGAAWKPQKVSRIREDPDLEACRAHGGTAEWTVLTIRSRPFEKPLSDPWAFFNNKLPPPPAKAPETEAEAKALAEKLRQQIQALRNDPDIAAVEESGPFWRMCSWRPPGAVRKSATVYQKLESGFVAKRYRYTLHVYIVNRTRFSVTDTVGQQNPLGGKCTTPKPYLLRKNWEADDALHYLVVARRPNRSIFFSDDWFRAPASLYTYAQVEVYNGISTDTFTQDWRVRLDRAYLLDEPFEAFDQADFSQFAAFTGTFLGGEDLDLGKYLWQVNNH